MKRFKIVDMWISITLILSCALYFFMDMNMERLLVGYFIVGGWQVISMIVHVATRTFVYAKGSRNIYHWITLVLLITMPAGSIWILLFTAPFMAVLYTWICGREVYIKMRRPLSLLK